jgi:hypothetical protein
MCLCVCLLLETPPVIYVYAESLEWLSVYSAIVYLEATHYII